MNIIIDNKENNKFISLLQSKLSISIHPLDIGDILFQYNDTPILYIERKTINDLAASLNDGRYHEQKARLKNRIRVIYLIEGKHNEMNPYYRKILDQEKFKGCIINTMVRDHIHVHCTANMEESVEFILDIHKRIPKYANLLIESQTQSQSQIEYSNAIDIKKKNNVTPAITFINQLRQIPGVSITIAQFINEKYNNMANLIHEFDTLNDKDKEKMLMDIKVGNKKLGKVLSKRIYEYLYNK